MAVRAITAAFFVALAAAAVALAVNAGDSNAQTGGSTRYQQISAGGFHTCALDQTGEVRCWGQNREEQVDVPSGRYQQVSAGNDHTCALSQSGEISCWGDNGSGQADAPSGRYQQISAGGFHTCALDQMGEVKCWGLNREGQSDALSGRYQQISAGIGHTCALDTDGAIHCWGRSYSGQTDVPSGRYQQVSAGGNHTCALDTDGAIHCWGQHDEYVLWDAPSGRYQQISGGWQHTCALNQSGEINCWGWTVSQQEAPPSGRYQQVSAGSYYTCALDQLGEISCWGPTWAREFGRNRQVDMALGRIVARRLGDGQIEFGWESGGGERVLPGWRVLPVGAPWGRWFSSLEVEVDGGVVGRINVWVGGDGRVEFAFTPAGGERISPRVRYFPADAVVGRWLRSSEIDLGGP